MAWDRRLLVGAALAGAAGAAGCAHPDGRPARLDDARRAVELARCVPGVQVVRNDILVSPNS